MSKKIIYTEKAPKAIGCYSQAVVAPAGRLVFLSGQIPLDAQTGEMVGDDPAAQIEQAFQNFLSVVDAAGLAVSDIVKINIYMTDLRYFTQVNSTMQSLISEPFPARAVVQVAALPRDAMIEIDGFGVLPD